MSILAHSKYQSQRFNVDDFYGGAAALAGRRADAEWDALGAILADPGKLVPVGVGEGLQAGHFDQPDLKIIWSAAVVGRDCEMVRILHLAMLNLREVLMWDTGHPPLPAGDRGCLWNEEKLAALACSFPPSATAVRHYSHRLIDIYNRQMEAAECLRRLAELLADSDSVPARLPAKNMMRLATGRAA